MTEFYPPDKLPRGNSHLLFFVEAKLPLRQSDQSVIDRYESDSTQLRIQAYSERARNDSGAIGYYVAFSNCWGNIVVYYEGA